MAPTPAPTARDLTERIVALRVTIAEYDARVGSGYGTRVYADDLARLVARLAAVEADS